MLDDQHLKSLVKKSQDGNRDAFGEIYDVMSEPVYRFIYMRVQHNETAEDLVSLTFLKAWKKIYTYKERHNVKFSTWLFQISHNTVRDHWRGKKYDENIDDHIFTDSLSGQFEEALDRKIEFAKVLNAMKRLPQNHQSVLTLRFINQLSVEESAKVLGKTNGGLRVMQVRALKALRNIIT